MESLEQQFLKRKVIYSEGGYVEIIDIQPKNLKFKTPLLLSSGWAETPEFLKETILTIANTGRRVIAIDYAKLDKVSTVSKDLSSNAKIKSRAIIKILEEENLKKIDVIAHSEGAINAILAAKIKPQNFKNIILVAPAGMIGKDTFPNLLKRFVRELFFGPLSKIGHGSIAVGQIIVILKYILINPIQAFGEAMGVSKTMIHKIVKNLSKKGIIIHIFHGKNDGVFPVEKIQDVGKKNHLNVHILEGGHNDLHLQPEIFIKKIMSVIN